MLFTILFTAVIHWLKGFALGDNLPPGQEPKDWQKVVNFITSDGFCGLYLAALVVLVVGAPLSVWSALGALLIFGMYGYGAEAMAHKRVLFVCWNANKADLVKYIDSWHERKIAGSFDKPKMAATRYGTFAGLGYSLVIILMTVLAYAADVEVGLSVVVAALLPLSYGLCYWAMNFLPNPLQYGETIGRGVYGVVLGIAAALVIGF